MSTSTVGFFIVSAIFGAVWLVEVRILNWQRQTDQRSANLFRLLGAINENLEHIHNWTCQTSTEVVTTRAALLPIVNRSTLGD